MTDAERHLIELFDTAADELTGDRNFRTRLPIVVSGNVRFRTGTTDTLTVYYFVRFPGKLLQVARGADSVVRSQFDGE